MGGVTRPSPPEPASVAIDVEDKGDDATGVAEERCRCGNIFMADSEFCRKCAAPRRQASTNSTPALDQSAVSFEACRQCGNHLMTDSVFCRKCGSRRELSVQVQAEKTQSKSAIDLGGLSPDRSSASSGHK